MKLELDIRVENLHLIETIAEMMEVDQSDVLTLVVEMGCEIARKAHGIESGRSELLREFIPA